MYSTCDREWSIRGFLKRSFTTGKKTTQQGVPPDRVPPPIKWTLSTNDKEGVYDGESESQKGESVPGDGERYKIIYKAF